MMNRDEIKVLLHHREPYLMVDRIDLLTAHAVTGVKVHRGDEAYLAGHFPGAPVVPGAMLQELCTQSAGALITKYYAPIENYDSEQTKGHALGVVSKVAYAKYMGIVKPQREVFAEVEFIERLGPLFKFKARVLQDGCIKAKLMFSLINLSDEHLF
jgi:3-hydroxyacyl-[acyl-carrier-protein] dehydratase|tara:strand:+ start:17216 stop:17683 length:468 start_codon:yes stop_codon:yes gene_type:complete